MGDNIRYLRGCKKRLNSILELEEKDFYKVENEVVEEKLKSLINDFKKKEILKEFFEKEFVSKKFLKIQKLEEVESFIEKIKYNENKIACLEREIKSYDLT